MLKKRKKIKKDDGSGYWLDCDFDGELVRHMKMVLDILISQSNVHRSIITALQFRILYTACLSRFKQMLCKSYAPGCANWLPFKGFCERTHVFFSCARYLIKDKIREKEREVVQIPGFIAKMESV